MSATLKYDYVRSTPVWRNAGARYDCVIFNGPNGLEFAKILAFFILHTSTTNYRLALIHQYHSIGHHSPSDYIQLQDQIWKEFILQTALSELFIFFHLPSIIHSSLSRTFQVLIFTFACNSNTICVAPYNSLSFIFVLIFKV